MAKKKRDTASGGKSGKKLQKAQQRLTQAQEMYAEAEARGQRAIEKAQARAAVWRKEAEERVQRRTEQLAAIEGRARKKTDSTPPPAQEPSATEIVDAPEVDTSAAIVLTGREAAALQALRNLGGSQGITAQEWRAAAGMSGTTFGRAREALVRYGLVTADGEPGRSTRYAMSQDGAGFDLDEVTQA